MKFSVLLPTRNRLEYLRLAIETVRRQSYGDWEVIVSDNDSQDDIAGYVASLADPRIRYFRTASFVPVTDNWNNALEQSTGDYILMLGDDDGLLPRYFERVMAAMQTFEKPDLIYTGAYFYAYPNVMPDKPAGFLRKDENRVFTGTEPYWLSAEDSRRIAKAYLDFEMPVASNMQFSLVSRTAVARLREKGSFYKSPYPDFYATPALFLTSRRILILRDQMVVIGITPKSYGYFHFNNRAQDGVKFLNNESALKGEKARLPGTSYNDSWLAANVALHASFGKEHGLPFNYRRYRYLQIIHCLKHRYYDRDLSAEALSDLIAEMTFEEKWLARPVLATGFSALGMVPQNLKARVIARARRAIGQHAMAESVADDQPFRDLLDVYAFFDDGPDRERRAA